MSADGCDLSNPVFRAAKLLYWSRADPMGGGRAWGELSSDERRGYVIQLLEAVIALKDAGFTVKAPEGDSR